MRRSHASGGHPALPGKDNGPLREAKSTVPDRDALARKLEAQRSRLVHCRKRIRTLTAQLDHLRQKMSEEQLIEAQQLARLGSWDWDIRENRVTWSEELYRLFGLDPQEFGASYEAFLDRVHPEDREQVDHVIREALSSNQSLDYYHRAVRPDGDIRILHCRGSVIRGADGAPLRMFGTAQDVTELKRAEEALRESEERFRLLVEGVKDYAIYLVDTEGRVASWNSGAERVTGYRSDEIVGKSISLFYSEGDARTGKPAAILRKAAEEGRCMDEGVQVRRDGSHFWATVVVTPLRENEGTLRGFVMVTQDITERKQMEETIRRQAYHDALTGLPNRMLFIDHLTLALTQAHRSRQRLAVMFLDLDRFKTINDSLGHTVGDKLLKAVAYRLRTSVREADTVARMGGDEYTILLSQISHEHDVIAVVEKILAAFKHPYQLDGHELRMTASIGISIFPGDGLDAEALMQNADTAMYHAKEQGRNNYQFYNPGMNIKAFRRIIIENSLRQTIERGELLLYYQPQIDLTTRSITGIEALVRWRHPELGLLSPVQFIPLAEETGLILSLDEWVLRTACTQFSAWQNAGRRPLKLTVNLSARQFQQPDFVETVNGVLRETSLDPARLGIEITESTAMQNVEDTLPKLAALSDRGVHFSIDDFGTGYSSLSYLKKLPIHKLKIDKSFIADLMVDPDYKIIISAIIAMAHSLRLKVVAEGVESEEQFSFLHSSCCDELQGYLFSEALPAERIEQLIASGP